MSEFLDKLTQPLQGDSPAGRDARYDEDYTQLRAEIDKMTAGSAEEGIDVRQVIETCRKILADRSRDMAIASFFCWALFRQGGYRALGEGLAAYEILLRDYWDTLFPPVARMAGRKNALEWLNLRLGEQLESATELGVDWATINDLHERMTSVAELVRQRFGEDAPVPHGVVRAITTKFRATPKPVDPTVLAAEAAAAAAAAPAGISSSEQAEEWAVKIADFYFESSPYAPAAHRVLRAARWDSLEALPPNERGRTMLPPPRENLKIELSTLAANANWKDLFTRTKEIYQEDACHFWLDLQRYSDLALDSLGEDSGALRMILLRDCASFVERMSGVEELSYNDGTPFADATTREWIEKIVKPSLSSGAGRSASSSALDESLIAEFAEARKAARAGKLKEAVSLLQAGLDAEGIPRRRFLRRLEIANVLVASGELEFALTVFEELDQTIERYRLAEWDRELAVQVWSRYLESAKAWTTLRAQFPNEDYAPLISSLKKKIGYYDTATALMFGERT